MSTESFYLAVLVVESSVGDRAEGDPLVDLQHRLIAALDPEEAYRKALELGRSAEHSYENSDGEVVRWTFAGLHDLRELEDPDLLSGTEIYSNLRRRASHHYVLPKDQLTEFYTQANKNKPVRKILEGK